MSQQLRCAEEAAKSTQHALDEARTRTHSIRSRLSEKLSHAMSPDSDDAEAEAKLKVQCNIYICLYMHLILASVLLFSE